MGFPLTSQFAQQDLDLAPAQRWKHFAELLHLRALCLVVLNMLQEKLLVGLPIEPALARIRATLPEVPVEALREEQARAPPTPYTLENPFCQQRLDPGP
jgi:hypothetical protein